MKTQITQLTFPDGFLDLGTGIPGLDLLPMDRLEQAAARYFAAGDRRTLQYGREQGSDPFLEGLAGFLSSSSENPVNPRSLMVTSGASGALDLLCTLYTQPGDLILVEEPTYFLALRIFADHGLHVEAVPMDEEGLVIEALEDKLRGKTPKFLYTIPTYHNPASVTLPLKRRRQLVGLAQDHGFLILADEVYRFLDYGEGPPRSLADFSVDTEQVISINSFSKILAPGLRLGWIQAHHSVIQKLTGCGLLDSGGGSAPFTCGVVNELIRAGDLTENLELVKAAYRGRLEVMDQALIDYLPEASYIKPKGGYYFWVRMPGVNTAAMRKLARARLVDYRPGALFSSRGGLDDRLRLSFSYFSKSELVQGIERLSEALRDYVQRE